MTTPTATLLLTLVLKHHAGLTLDDVQSRMKDAKSFQLPSNKTAEIPKEAPRFEDIKLIDYDFKTYGDPAKRKELLERWDKEIGATAN